MTQPTVHFDESFPPPQKSETQELTEAVRDLAAAIRGRGRPQEVNWFADVEGRLQRYNELRPVATVTDAAPEGSAIMGDFSDETWRADPEPVDDGRGETPLADWEKDLLYSLDDLPDGAYVDLDPPRLLPKEAAERADIYLEEPLPVRRVVKGDWPRRDPGDLNPFPWCAWDITDDPEFSTPWEFETEQVEALKLSYSDFTLPTVPRPEPEEDVVNTPSHYRQEDGLECIDFSADLTGPWFSVVRYVWRCMDKGNPVQDLEKALRYIEIAEEKGLDKPESGERARVFLDLWGDETEDLVAEQRYYTLCAIFSPSHGAADVRLHVEELLCRVRHKGA